MGLLVENYIEATGAWFAIDEAQTSHKKKAYTKLSDDVDQAQYTEEKRSLLHILSIYALPGDSKRIIAGTSLTDFELLLKSGGAKRSIVYYYAQQGLSFPYIEPEDGWGRIEEYFDFSEIKPKYIAEAKEVLQGRLRYVFGFIKQLAAQIVYREHSNNKFSAEEKNDIFISALKDHREDMKKYFAAHWQRLVKWGVCMYYFEKFASVNIYL